MINETYTKCQPERKENLGYPRKPEVQYYMKGQPVGYHKDLFKVTGKLMCGTCYSEYLLCPLRWPKNNSTNNTLVLEHLSNSGVLQSIVQTKPNTKTIPTIKSLQEFQYIIYLQNDMQDVLIITLPFVHLRNQPLNLSYKLLNKFINLVNRYIPQRVKVVWVPMVTSWKFPDPIYHNMTADEKSALLNRRLFALLKPKIETMHSNWYAFYDMQSVTCPLKFLTTDGVHYEPIYYEIIMKQIFHLLCL